MWTVQRPFEGSDPSLAGTDKRGMHPCGLQSYGREECQIIADGAWHRKIILARKEGPSQNMEASFYATVFSG